MIIDLILDRKAGVPYNVKEAYEYIQAEEGIFFPEYPISRAMDGGNEEDVKAALCAYIMTDYNPAICDYVNSVDWLTDDENPMPPQPEEHSGLYYIEIKGQQHIGTYEEVEAIADEYFEKTRHIVGIFKYEETQQPQETTPAVIPDSLVEEYTKAGCTFGRCKDTKYIQVVRVVSTFSDKAIVFLYRGSKKGAFEEVKKQFDGFVDAVQNSHEITMWYDKGNGEFDSIIARCEQLEAAGLKDAAVDWAVRRTAFPAMPLQLPAITESAVYEAAARIRANYEAIKEETQQTAADELKQPSQELVEEMKKIAINEEAAITLATIKANAPAAGLSGIVLDSVANLIRPELLEAKIKEITAPAIKKADTPRNQKSDMLQDWGEKIGGARKDEAHQHSNGAAAPAPVKKLKYGLTCRAILNEEGEKVSRWYLKVSPKKYTSAVYVDTPAFEWRPGIIQEKDGEREEAEKALIEKYPNFENFYKFDIYQLRQGQGFSVEAKRVQIRVATFDSLKAARDYMNTDRPAADLEAAKAARDSQQSKRAAAMVVRNSINRPRVGTDYAQGRNITPEELATRFGLRAVEFGNWMNADDRQTSINECYNSFRTLAELLNVPDEKIGRGTLAVAFGARGTGKANAHYEPARHVINLTRTRGAGSLAHEWAHSIDFDGTEEKHLSKGFYCRSEIYFAYGYSERSKRAGSYWGSEHEQFARAFETAIHYELKERGVVDDYLVNIIEDCKVYPTDIENKRIAPNVISKICKAL